VVVSGSNKQEMSGRSAKRIKKSKNSNGHSLNQSEAAHEDSPPIRIKTEPNDPIKKDQDDTTTCAQLIPSSPTPSPTPTAFKTATLFHVNPFMKAGVRNVGLGPFIREQFVTLGFGQVGLEAMKLINSGDSRSEIRRAIVGHWERQHMDDGDRSKDAIQTAIWLTKCNIESYILMRHENGNCPHLPKMLQDEAGDYVGPVYVLGKVVKVLKP